MSKFNKTFEPKKGDRARSAAIGAATRRRRNWEASDEGIARTRTASDLATNVDGSTGVNMPIGQIYHLLGFTQNATGPKEYDVQLPGMADPNMAPRPPRWHELTAEQQSHAIEGMRQHGTSLEQISRDIGAQLDQAYFRARSYGKDVPYAMDFYEPGSQQHDKMQESARNVGLPLPIYSMVHGMTSPNTKFQHEYTERSADVKKGTRQAGDITFPNDEAAMHVARSQQAGATPQTFTNELGTTGTGSGRAQGYVSNMKKALVSLEQFSRGIPPSEWVTRPDGGGPFDASPKAGPYANSWASNTHPEYFVSDVHSGGGGAFPHLSSEKPVKRDAEGNAIVGPDGKPKRDKSERERALEKIPFVQAAIDEAARMAMRQRNLPSLRMTQAGQWGEEQIQRPDISPDSDTAYSASSPQTFSVEDDDDDEKPVQQTLF
jgi:hypothetical protein